MRGLTSQEENSTTLIGPAKEETPQRQPTPFNKHGKENPHFFQGIS